MVGGVEPVGDWGLDGEGFFVEGGNSYRSWILGMMEVLGMMGLFSASMGCQIDRRQTDVK